MKKVKLAIVLFSVLFIVFFLSYSGLSRFLPKKLESRVYSKESSTAGVIEVGAVPKELGPGREMIFTLNLNNHTMNLDYDYAKMAVVIDDRGNIYKPVKWISEGGGHHISGDLVFSKLSNKATHVGLNISGIDNKNVNFDWEM